MSWGRKEWLEALGTLAAVAATVYTGGAAAPALAAAAEGAGGAAAGAGAAATGSGIAASGMFAGAVPDATAELAAAQAAAAGGSSSGLSAGGLFAQVPGVSAGSQQAAMLAAQNEGFGGVGADLTAKAAMPAVQNAYASGQMGTMDYLGNVAKGDMAGMNDPNVWASRVATNAGRMAGGAGKAAAANMLASSMAPRGSPQGAMVRNAVSAPPSQSQPTAPAGSAAYQQAVAELKSNRITIDEFLRRVGGAA